MAEILTTIAEHVRGVVERRRRELPLSALRQRPLYSAPPRGFANASSGATRRVIAEVKKASPSKGLIRADFDPVAIARSYEAAGADCLSVLTDAPFFQGSLEYLGTIRQAANLPLLRKDFIIDERQILEAVQWGADAILLIVAILDDEQLGRFHRLTVEGGLTALVEVHDESELDRALAVGARLIGVNNRNLGTFQVDLATTERLAGRLRSGERLEGASAPLLVAESGIHTYADTQRLAQSGVRAILVGESLMRKPDVGEAVRALMRGTEPNRARKSHNAEVK
jgi:indole-3-glycerol phosphate synthase